MERITFQKAGEFYKALNVEALELQQQDTKLNQYELNLLIIELKKYANYYYILVQENKVLQSQLDGESTAMTYDPETKLLHVFDRNRGVSVFIGFCDEKVNHLNQPNNPTHFGIKHIDGDGSIGVAVPVTIHGKTVTVKTARTKN